MSSYYTYPKPMVTIDHEHFPHIFEQVVRNTPFEFLKTLRACSRYYCHQVDTELLRHVKTQPYMYHPGRPHYPYMYHPDKPRYPWLLLVPGLGLPLSWYDNRARHVQVLDASRTILAAGHDFAHQVLAPRLLRFQLSGLLDPAHFRLQAPTVVVFIAPQELPSTIHCGGEVVTSDDPLFPDSQRWASHFRPGNRIPPCILGLPQVDMAATERLVFNLHVHPDHHMFGQWEIDFATSHRLRPLQIYVVASRDDAPLGWQHQMPRGTPLFEGRILNRLLLCIGRMMARNLPRVQVAFINANSWDHNWLATSFVDKSSYFEIDEDDLDLDGSETATMEERIQYWLNEAIENQFEQYMGAPFNDDADNYTRFLTFDEFRAEIPDNDFVFDRIMCP
ncbi:hypothetical protein CcaverHIS002_0202360 [Cutaneotrichosporon cavernicola]|nr:hypothetical protein CcaverHIS002_0202360 [Cutaneotrichosporon cavernicola]BEI96652.1 hypothetical protein CcaverHIS631_0202410 [Cutaneotrichosporon cavernicola]